MNIKLVYASLTGNTEMLSDLIIEKFEEEKGIEIEKLFIEDMVDFDFFNGVNDYEIVNNVVKLLKNEYGIEHVTVQIENPEINPHL